MALLKEGTQRRIRTGDTALDRKLLKDDVADFAEWKRQADTLDWHPSSFCGQGPPAPLVERGERIEYAYRAALPLLEAELHRRAVLPSSEARVIAARGLIAAGIEDHWDVDRIVSRFLAAGVTQEGRATRLHMQEAGRFPRMTTGLHIEQEREFGRLAEAAAVDSMAQYQDRRLRRRSLQTAFLSRRSSGTRSTVLAPAQSLAW